MTWWRPSYALRFGRNIAYWLHDFTKMSLREQQRYVCRKVASLSRKALRRISPRNGDASVDLEDVIDPSLFPASELKLWQIHLNAIRDHADQPYDGEVVLLRTRGQALFCSLDEDFCWRKLARNGVKIRFVPGSHESVFMEPNVKTLAGEVQASLQQSQGATRPVCPQLQPGNTTGI